MINLSQLEEKQKKLLNSSKKIRAFLDGLVDEDSFVETDVFMAGKSFVDGSDALGEGVITGYATLNGRSVYLAVQNGEVLGGSLGKAHADKILKCIERAERDGSPLISVIDSNGARVGEGVAVLEGYASIIAAATKLKENCAHVAVVKGNAVGLMGVYAAAADFVLLGKDSVTSMTAPLAVEGNKASKPQDNFGAKVYAEGSLLPSFTFGDEKEAKTIVSNLFEHLDPRGENSSDDPNRTSKELNRSVNADAILKAVADDKKSLEIFKDFAKSVKTCFTFLNNVPVGIVITNADGAHDKLCACSMKKIKKFAKILNEFGIPMINFVDCKGLKSNLEKEQSGLVLKASKFMQHIAKYTMPKISVITGNAIGFGYAALASKALGYDYVLALPDSVIAPVTSEMAVSIEYKDEITAAKDPVAAREKIAEEYRKNEASPFVSAKDGYVDNIVEPALLRPYLASALTMLI